MPGNQPAQRVVPGQIRPGNLPRKEELMLQGSGSWLERRSRKPCLIYQAKKIWMGSPPYMALLPGVGPIQVATPRVLVPRGVCPPVSGHWSFTHWTRRHHRPATGHRHYTEYCKSVNQGSSSHQSLDLEIINPGESQYSPPTGQPATGHRLSAFISTYI